MGVVLLNPEMTALRKGSVIEICGRLLGSGLNKGTIGISFIVPLAIARHGATQPRSESALLSRKVLATARVRAYAKATPAFPLRSSEEMLSCLLRESAKRGGRPQNRFYAFVRRGLLTRNRQPPLRGACSVA